MPFEIDNMLEETPQTIKVVGVGGGGGNAVERMIDDGRDCAEVFVQLAAVRSAINNICKIILRDHMNHCVIDAVQKGDTETLSELDKAIDLLMK